MPVMTVRAVPEGVVTVLVGLVASALPAAVLNLGPSLEREDVLAAGLGMALVTMIGAGFLRAGDETRRIRAEPATGQFAATGRQ